MEIAAYTIAGYTVYWYGIIAAAAVLLGSIVAKLVAVRYCEPFDYYMDTILLSLPTGLVLARAFYVMGNWQLYSQTPSEILRLTEGGISIYGAAAAFLLTAYFYTSYRRYPLGRVLDILTPAVISGLCVVQFGNFAMQTVVGRPTEYFKLAEYIEFAFRPSGFEGYEYFMPVALYQAFWLLVVLCIVAALYKKQCPPSFDGSIALIALVLVLAGRVLLGLLYLSFEEAWCVHITSLLWLIAAGGALLRQLYSRAFRAGKYTLRI